MVLRRCLVVLPYIILIANVYCLFCVTPDDAFITYRYATHLLGGYGPVFNIGQRVEGFSSPLHLFLSVLLIALFPALDILFKAKVIGLAFAALALWQTGRLGRAADLSDAESLLAQTLVALNVNFALAAVNGLETTLFVALVLAVVLALDKEGQGRGGYRSAALLFLAELARPEAMLIFWALLVIQIFRARRGQGTGRQATVWAAAFLLPTAALLLARWAYYGQFVPNTYYAKLVTVGYGLRTGLAYLSHPVFPVDVRNLLFLPVRKWAPNWAVQWQALGTVIFWGLAVLGCARLRAGRLRPVLLAVFLSQVAFVLRFGGDWMPGWRFLMPALPVLALWQVAGLRQLRRPGMVGKFGAAVVAVGLWGICCLVSPHHPWSNVGWSTQSADLLSEDNTQGRQWVLAADFIHKNLPSDSLIAYSEMGYAGFTNMDKSFIDMRGLTDPDVAHLPARFKGSYGVDDEEWLSPTDPLYQILERRRPTVIIDFSAALPPEIILGRYHLAATVANLQDPYYIMAPVQVYLPEDQAPTGAPQ